MTDLLDEFFKSNGISKNIAEFNSTQETEIQSVIDSVFKPSFEALSEKFNSYNNVTGELSTSKKYSESVRERVEFKVFKTGKLKFTYQPKFSILNGIINVIGQFCIPDIYGECSTYTNTDLNLPLKGIKKEVVKENVISAFIKNVDIK